MSKPFATCNIFIRFDKIRDVVLLISTVTIISLEALLSFLLFPVDLKHPAFKKICVKIPRKNQQFSLGFGNFISA